MRSLFLYIFVAMFALILATGRHSEREEEGSLRENSLSHVPKNASMKKRSSGLLNSFISDPTVPVFLVMGLASLATILTASSAPARLSMQDMESDNEILSRRRRSLMPSGWSEEVLQLLSNVKDAVEKYQKFEEDIIDKLNQPS